MPTTAALSSNRTVFVVGSLVSRIRRRIDTPLPRASAAVCRYATSHEVDSATSDTPRTRNAATAPPVASWERSRWKTPSAREKIAPATKMNTAARKAQKNRSRP